MDNNIINYLNQKNTLKKSVKYNPKKKVYKKPVRRKIRWGSKIGGKGAIDYSKKTPSRSYSNRRTQTDPIDRLLTLMASSLMLNQQSSQDKQRVNQIDSDRGIAQVLQEEEILQQEEKYPKMGEPKMGEPTQEEKNQTMGEFEAYSKEFNHIEDDLQHIEEQLIGITNISAGAANDFKRHLTGLNKQKVDLQNNLNSKLKNTQNVWTWRAVLEQSGDDLNALVKKETEINQLLFDKLDKRLQEQEITLKQNKQTLIGREQDLSMYENQAQLEKLDLEEKIKQIGEAKKLQEDLLFKTEREKKDLENNIGIHHEFIEKFETERDTIFMSQQEKIQDLERKNKLLVREQETTGTAAGLTDIEVMEQFIAGKITSAKVGEVQTAIDRLGIRGAQGIPQKQAREYYREKIEEIQKNKDKAKLTPFVSSVPKPTLFKSIELVPDKSVESFASMGSDISDRSDRIVREQTESEARMFATSKLGSGTPASAQQRLEQALAGNPVSSAPPPSNIDRLPTETILKGLSREIMRQPEMFPARRKARQDLEALGL
tara:strand:- start:3570 stop:5201 length:1632 start_codon:yes stop_codon:yes gene_type:complete